MEAFLWSEGWLLRLPGSKGKKILIYFCWMLKWKYGLLGSFNYSEPVQVHFSVELWKYQTNKWTNASPFPGQKRKKWGYIFLFWDPYMSVGRSLVDFGGTVVATEQKAQRWCLGTLKAGMGTPSPDHVLWAVCLDFLPHHHCSRWKTDFSGSSILLALTCHLSWDVSVIAFTERTRTCPAFWTLLHRLKLVSSIWKWIGNRKCGFIFLQKLPPQGKIYIA